MSLSLHGGGAAWVALERPERRYHYCQVVVVAPFGSLVSDLSDAIIIIYGQW